MRMTLAVVPALWLAASPAPEADDVLARTRAAYGALTSYSDTGVIKEVFAAGPAGTYTHRFKTYFRAPRRFYYEFDADPRAGGARMVIWCDGGDFQSWSTLTQHHDVYPEGTGTATTPFAQMAYATKGTVALVPALLFAGSGLVGTFNEFADGAVAGEETVGGRRSVKLSGVARSYYPRTQRVTGQRPAALWIDAENGLLRRAFEDKPDSLPATAVSNVTITLEATANPALDDAVFRFAAPSAKK
jgi:hypothetical protein